MSTILRNAFGEYLVELGKKRNDFVVFTADTGSGTGTKTFIDHFPERSFNFGIAEANMVSAAAGFSTFGITPIVNTYGVFATSRVADQIRNSICYPNFNVKLVASHVGLDAGADGASHMSVEDLALIRSIPNIIVLVPADRAELFAMTSFMLDYRGPVFMRTTRSLVPDVHDENHRYSFPLATCLRAGEDITLVACGVMVQRALEAAKILASKGLSAEVINCSTVKPIDEASLIASAKKTKRVITVEDHNVIGGLGGAVSEVLSRKYPVPMRFIGIPDRFGLVGTPEEIYHALGMDPERIAEEALQMIRAPLLQP